MTTHELARQLLAGPDVMATVRGYEGGVNEINAIEPCMIVLNEHLYHPCYGKHDRLYHETPDERRRFAAICDQLEPTIVEAVELTGVK